MNNQQKIAKLQALLSKLKSFDGFENFEAVCGKGLGDDAISDAMEKDRIARAEVSRKKEMVLKAIDFLEQQDNLDLCLSMCE